ncbi:endolytic transglycosylase MltG [Clostridium sp.]|uniref:endolytic transglycosylase MltG n=1 Tax=Clostridium sp. TaxID=1506 RepID=UPI003F333F53
MKNSKLKSLIPLIVIILILAIPIVLFTKSISDPLKSKDTIVVKVEEGDNFYSILGELKENGQISGVSFIKLYLKVTNKDLDVKPGEYTLDNNMSINDIVTKLTTESLQNAVKFTVPEGYSVEDIAGKLEKEGICSYSEFIETAKEYKLPSFIKGNAEKRYSLEGYLYPDTYSINKNENPEKIIEIMVNRFKEVWNEALEISNLKVNEDDMDGIITVASMIEKESRVDEERPLISSVIYNRIEKGMKLQIDATVIYALGNHVETVLNSHLETESPYNTYRIDGLPIGPIANPGLPSILAALNPEKTDYLFYVLENDNLHHYFTNDDVDFMNKLNELGY